MKSAEAMLILGKIALRSLIWKLKRLLFSSQYGILTGFISLKGRINMKDLK